MFPQPLIKPERVDEPENELSEVGASDGSSLLVGFSDGSSLNVGSWDGSSLVVGSAVGSRVGE